MPGFGEQMRQISLHYVPTAILSRQVGAIRKQALIINLPGQPKSIKETLEGVKDEQGNAVVHLRQRALLHSTARRALRRNARRGGSSISAKEARVAR